MYSSRIRFQFEDFPQPMIGYVNINSNNQLFLYDSSFVCIGIIITDYCTMENPSNVLNVFKQLSNLLFLNCWYKLLHFTYKFNLV